MGIRGKNITLRPPCKMLAARCAALETLFHANWRLHLFDRTIIEMCDPEFRHTWPREIQESRDFREAFFGCFPYLRDKDYAGFKHHVLGIHESLRLRVLNIDLYDLWHGTMAHAVVMARMPELLPWLYSQGANTHTQNAYEENPEAYRARYMEDMEKLHPEGLNTKVILAPDTEHWMAQFY